MISWYQNLPLHIDPIAFSVGSFSIRWYAISYLLGFSVVYCLLRWRIRKGEIKNIYQISNDQPASPAGGFPISPPKADPPLADKQFPITNDQFTKKIRNTKYEIQDTLVDFLIVSFFSALIGGRIGYVLIYNLPYFVSNLAYIISPFDSSGKFVGIYGMSYYGALLGIIISSLIFLKIKKIAFWQWADFVVPAVPLGYFFGRIGNFLNGELYGRVTNLPLGMYFASDPMTLRFPSQLLEALLEGLVLFAILWKMRKIKLNSGTLFLIYLIGYGIFRIICEFFREPDPQIGFLFRFFTMGQLLSAFIIIAGLFALLNPRQVGVKKI
jgi:phosphatidylglycerol:prolipoprotein diacylglycerol transferase